MLQVCLYAERPFSAGSTASNNQRTLGSRPTLGEVLAIGLGWLTRRTDDALSDHLLDDIGLSRADYAALKL